MHRKGTVKTMEGRHNSYLKPGSVIPKVLPEVNGEIRCNAIKLWLIGLFGTLGLHFLIIGRPTLALKRLVYGVTMWVMVILFAAAFISSPELLRMSDPPILLFACASLVLLFTPAVIDFIRISRGTINDRVIKIDKRYHVAVSDDDND